MANGTYNNRGFSPAEYLIAIGLIIFVVWAGWYLTKSDEPLPTVTGIITSVQCVPEGDTVQSAYLTYEDGRVVRLRILNDSNAFAFYTGRPTVITHTRQGFIRKCEIK